MLALVEASVESVDEDLFAIRSAHRSPLNALVDAALFMARGVESPEVLANHLAFRQIDLSDPDFHRLVLDNARRLRAGFRRLLDESVAAGEPLPCDTSALARAIEALSGGSLIAWSIHRDGDSASFVRADVETLLARYRPAASP